LLISGDYAGYAQSELERLYPGVQAMFMAGCGGDANPYPRGSEQIAREHGLNLAAEVARVLNQKLRPVRGPIRTAYKEVALPLEPPPDDEQIERLHKAGGWKRFVAERMKSIKQKEGKLPCCYRAGIAVWQFGDDLTLVGLPGEVVVDYVPLIQKAIGPTRLWIAAYCNDMFGYLPSARVLAEGGYECRGIYSGGIGFFSPKAEQLTVETVAELARKLGRKSATR
jgi:hypothetical protein